MSSPNSTSIMVSSFWIISLISFSPFFSLKRISSICCLTLKMSFEFIFSSLLYFDYPFSFSLRHFSKTFSSRSFCGASSVNGWSSSPHNPNPWSGTFPFWIMYYILLKCFFALIIYLFMTDLTRAVLPRDSMWLSITNQIGRRMVMKQS